MSTRFLVIGILLAGLPRAVSASSCTVPSGACPTIQAALDQAVAGNTISVSPGTYSEKINFSHSGSAGGGYITLQGAPGLASIVDGTGVSGDNLILIDHKSYVKVVGLHLRNNRGVSDGSGIRVLGSGTNIELRNNRIHEIRGSDAMGITVYGTDASSISNLIIDGNEIYDCDPARSEALTLNGNVELFAVTNNVVRDVNNIGIDFIGGETDIQPDPSKVVRNGICSDNQVYRARSIYEGGYGAAIYVDGARDIVIERNITSESDLGLEVGAENAGTVTRNITVRDNIIYRNDKVGIVFGGFDENDAGRVEDCSFLNNTVIDNDTLNTGVGELWIQFASDNLVRNNIFSSAQETLLYSEDGNINNQLDYNLWFTSHANPTFVWSGTGYSGFGAFKTGTGQELHGLYAAPQLANPSGGDFHLGAMSPAYNAGDPAFVAAPGETDIDGSTRVSAGRVDIGADETNCGDTTIDAGEDCDDGNLNDCDGCDTNCTFSVTCGNGIVCAGEQCDDGNSNDGDCCSASCGYEIVGSGCDDGDLCTDLDECDGGGQCNGTAAPAPSCKSPIGTGRAILIIRDQSANERDQLKWKWSRGEATTPADLGLPDGATRYALCLYDSSANPQPRLHGEIPAGLKWSARNNGFRYKDAGASAAGIRSVGLKTGVDGRASISLSGKGALLDLPALPLTAPVTFQLRNQDGSCWGASFSMPALNSPAQFKAKGE